MKVTTVVIDHIKVRQGPAKRCKVVIVHVILPGGVDIQPVDMKPTDDRKKIRVSCFKEKGLSTSKSLIPSRRWGQLNAGLSEQIEGKLQEKLDMEKAHRVTGEADEMVVDVPNNLQVESVGLQDPYNLFLRDRRTRRECSRLEAHAYSPEKKTRLFRPFS